MLQCQESIIVSLVTLVSPFSCPFFLLLASFVASLVVGLIFLFIFSPKAIGGVLPVWCCVVVGQCRPPFLVTVYFVLTSLNQRKIVRFGWMYWGSGVFCLHLLLSTPGFLSRLFRRLGCNHLGLGGWGVNVAFLLSTGVFSCWLRFGPSGVGF